jgi:hypothetical protein
MTYENGWGSAKIDPEAVHWYWKALELGYPPAEYGLSVDLISRRAIESSGNALRRNAILGDAVPIYVARSGERHRNS